MRQFWIILALCVLVIGSGLQAQKTPDEFHGVQVGSDGTLVIYPEIIKYFQYLDEQSDRLKLSNEGTSTLGQPMMLAAISSAENIARLDELIEINRKLANPDQISPEEASRLIARGKTFVLITCAIHATEIAATQMGMNLAHKLVTSRDSGVTDILDRTVLLFMPSINPDGNIMVTDWYNKYKGTEFEGGRMPFLYHHYAGHDNNRDFYMLNLKETRVVNAVLHHRYFPHIYLDMHQMGSSGPRMFVPPFKDPLNQNLDPVMIKEVDLIGTFMALKLQENHKSGVASAYAFDAYWPGGSKNTAWYKNVVGVLTELASVRTATPVYTEQNELRVSSKGLPEYKPQVNFPDPWPGGWWRLQDIMDYEMIAAEALLELAAQNRQAFLNNFYQMGVANIEAGRKSAPYGYLVPSDQWDAAEAVTFLKIMEEHGLRLYQLAADVTISDRIYRKGATVIPWPSPMGIS